MKVFLDVLHVAASNESVEVHHIEIQFSVGVIDTLTTCSAGTKTQPFPILANSLQVQLQRGHSVQSQQWSLIPGRCRRAPTFQILTELYPAWLSKLYWIKSVCHSEPCISDSTRPCDLYRAERTPLPTSTKLIPVAFASLLHEIHMAFKSLLNKLHAVFQSMHA